MEALGAAASVTQFVLLSLKCVKEAHDALSQYKDGPDILNRLRNDLLGVQNILEALCQSENASTNTPLDAHIKQSIEGLCSIAERLIELQTTPGDKGSRRFWKHLKLVLSENDMNRIRNLQGRLSSIQQTIDLTSSISTSSSSDIHSLLNEIKGLVVSEGRATREASASNNIGVDGTTSKPQKSAMLESIERLGALIDEKRETVDVYAEDDELAESAIEDLRNMLTAVRGGQELKLEKELDKGLRRFGRSFGQNKFSINTKSKQHVVLMGNC
ncbi:hypothetical protein ACHAP8_003786 [Fusarium lateritium]